eukprot:3956712-Prymnesium_polylepis.1
MYGADDDDAEYYDNIYSVAVHELLWPTSVEGVLSCISLLSVLLFMQVILTFAFWDSSWLQVLLGQMPQFTDNV